MLGILAVLGGLNFTELVVGSVLFGLFDALIYPASTALLPDIVASEHLTASNSLNRISGTLLGGLFGPLVGPVVASTIGVSWALIIDAGTFVVSASCLLLMRATARPLTTQTNVVREIIEGLSYGRKMPRLIWIISVAGLANALVFSPTAVMLPSLFKRVLHVSNFMVGVGFAALGLGGMLGGIVRLVGGRFWPEHLRVGGVVRRTRGGRTIDGGKYSVGFVTAVRGAFRDSRPRFVGRLDFLLGSFTHRGGYRGCRVRSRRRSRHHCCAGHCRSDCCRGGPHNRAVAHYHRPCHRILNAGSQTRSDLENPVPMERGSLGHFNDRVRTIGTRALFVERLVERHCRSFFPAPSR